MSDSQRIEALEHVVRHLAREVERLRAELDALTSAQRGPGDSSAPSTPADLRVRSPAAPPPTRPPHPPRRTVERTGRAKPLELETLVGRYGALALAALAILLGVGVFLSWAVEHIHLGPEARVALGAVAAAGVAALGIRLCGRGARRFGNILLGLALAIAHVVAWGAGPYLGVVPQGVAFAAAAIASAALAWLAWRENEEALFAVGVGGALIAPFVTSEGAGPLAALLAFGLLVIASAHLAIADRPWRVASRLVMAGIGLYAGAALAAPGGPFGNSATPFSSAAPVAFAVACAWLAIAIGGVSHRLRVGRAALATALLALLASGMAQSDALRPELIVVAFVLQLTTYALLLRAPVDDTRDASAAAVVVALLLPLGSLFAAFVAIPDPATLPDGGIAAAWAAAAAAVSRLESDVRRDAHHFVAVVALTIAAALLLEDHPEAAGVATAAIAAAASMLARRVEPMGLVVGALCAVLYGTIWSFMLLEGRPAFAYTPFLSPASAAASAIVAAWWVWGVAAGKAVAQDNGALRTLIRLAGPTVAFLWGYAELARAFSRETALFLIILYLAAAGVLSILLGRARSLPPARHIGLALAIVAGVRAIVQASELGMGLRLSSYLVVGAFLLGIAYLYRATADSPAAPTDDGRVAAS